MQHGQRPRSSAEVGRLSIVHNPLLLLLVPLIPENAILPGAKNIGALAGELL